MTTVTLRALFDRAARREADDDTDPDRLTRRERRTQLVEQEQLAAIDHTRRHGAAEQDAQVFQYGPTRGEWQVMAWAEERRMRFALEARRAWREADTRPQPNGRQRKKETA